MEITGTDFTLDMSASHFYGPRFESQGRLLRFHNCDNDNYNHTQQQHTVAINQQDFGFTFYLNRSDLYTVDFNKEKHYSNLGRGFVL